MPAPETAPPLISHIKRRQGSAEISLPDGRKGEDKINNAETEGSEKSSDIVCSRLDEDCRGIEGNDVDYEG